VKGFQCHHIVELAWSLHVITCTVEPNSWGKCVLSRMVFKIYPMSWKCHRVGKSHRNFMGANGSYSKVLHSH